MRFFEGPTLRPSAKVLFACPEGEHNEAIALDGPEHQITNESRLPVNETSPGSESIEEIVLVTFSDGYAVLYYVITWLLSWYRDEAILNPCTYPRGLSLHSRHDER